MNSDVRVLGGVSLKVVLPHVLCALKDCLLSNGSTFPQGPLRIVYRVEVRGKVYYSNQYQWVKKRNSFTIAYLDYNGLNKYGLILYLFVNK